MLKPIPLDERLNIAAQLLKRARIFYDIWWYYEGKDTRSKILDTMDNYSEFFRFDSHAHFVAMVTHLALLFEARKDTVNVEALIHDAKAAGVSNEAVDEAQLLMTNVAGIQSKVAILRSNLFGHRSGKLSYTEVFRKAALKPNQLRGLTDVGLKIINTLRNARRLDIQFFNDIAREDVESLINDLAKINAS